ncbi:hypothetical protein [Yoonia sp. 2307UL14-13]|uniref:hypothetical protein n=1 Tax=Yoonia sp. 2307UL14-13 TaxID=3126506 RepID=UPI0030B13F06
MLNVTQRIDLMKLAVDLTKFENGDADPLPERAKHIFSIFKEAVEAGNALDDTNITDVKAAVDVASGI